MNERFLPIEPSAPLKPRPVVADLSATDAREPAKTTPTTSISRRSFLYLSALAGAQLCLKQSRGAQTTSPTDRYVTSFYQFNAEAVKRLSYHSALPNGPGFEHIFVHSTLNPKDAAEKMKHVHAAGESFKFAWAYDAHTHNGWTRASDDDLKKWAMEFREKAFALDPAPDYFAFNEMPSTGHTDPETRNRVTKLIRYLNDPGDGKKWRGVFYFVEENSRPKEWRGDATEFFETLDQTCDHVIAEHFHTDYFVFDRTLQQFTDHLFALPRWMRDSGKSPQMNIARNKFMVMHSSYWSRGYYPWTSLYRDLRMLRFHPSVDFYQQGRITPWQGLLTEDHDMSDLEKFFQRCLAATRADELGKSRIAFSPLAIAQPMGGAMLPLLARTLAKDAAKFGKEAS